MHVPILNVNPGISLANTESKPAVEACRKTHYCCLLNVMHNYLLFKSLLCGKGAANAACHAI